MAVVDANLKHFLFVPILILLCKDLGRELVKNLFLKTDLFKLFSSAQNK